MTSPGWRLPSCTWHHPIPSALRRRSARLKLPDRVPAFCQVLEHVVSGTARRDLADDFPGAVSDDQFETFDGTLKMNRQPE